jgi:hypothetical protein
MCASSVIITIAFMPESRSASASRIGRKVRSAKITLSPACSMM